jgi:hypothetical protein
MKDKVKRPAQSSPVQSSPIQSSSKKHPCRTVPIVKHPTAVNTITRTGRLLRRQRF